MRALPLLFLAVSIADSSAFQLPSSHTSHTLGRSTRDVVGVLRGGDMSPTQLSSILTPVSEALVSASPIRAVGALYAVASMTVVPLTLYRQAYSFSVGE